MKRFILCIAIMICQLFTCIEGQAADKQAKDTTAARLSIEFRRLYIYQKTAGVRSSPVLFDPHRRGVVRHEQRPLLPCHAEGPQTGG